MLKRTIPTAGLAVLPRTGHTANLEDPASSTAPLDALPRRTLPRRRVWPSAFCRVFRLRGMSQDPYPVNCCLLSFALPEYQGVPEGGG